MTIFGFILTILFAVAMVAIIKINKKMNTIIELIQKNSEDKKEEQATLLYFY